MIYVKLVYNSNLHYTYTVMHYHLVFNNNIILEAELICNYR